MYHSGSMVCSWCGSEWGMLTYIPHYVIHNDDGDGDVLIIYIWQGVKLCLHNNKIRAEIFEEKREKNLILQFKFNEI